VSHTAKELQDRKPYLTKEYGWSLDGIAKSPQYKAHVVDIDEPLDAAR